MAGSASRASNDQLSHPLTPLYCRIAASCCRLASGGPIPPHHHPNIRRDHASGPEGHRTFGHLRRLVAPADPALTQ